MKRIEHRMIICIAFAGAFLIGLLGFVIRLSISGGSWASAAFNRHLYNTQGQLMAGTILDRDGDVLTTVEDGKRVYHESETVRKAVVHAVGDLNGNIGTGALNAFGDQLSAYNLLNGAYHSSEGNSLYLTIDARYHYSAYQALDGKKGAVAVYNYKTGEVLCMLSTPGFDPVHVPQDINSNSAYDGAYVNRALSSTFTPGSIFKTITLSAALEKLPKVKERVWNCDGTVVIGGKVITCSGKHGEQTLQKAYANSCNCVFAEVATELGSSVLQQYAEKAGLTSAYSIDGIPTAKGSFNWEKMTSDELAWAGIGQDKDLVNPCAWMVYMGAIANGGKAAVPHIILKKENSAGIPALPHLRKWTDILTPPSTSATLREWMGYNVEKVYGLERFPNMRICAKSGTAEVGSNQKPNAWFTGFLMNEDAPLAFAVVVENGGSGSAVAGTVAGKVLDVIVNGYT